MRKKAKSAGSERVPAHMASAGGALKIYYIATSSIGGLGNWPRQLERAREMGFGHLGVSPIFAPHAEGGVFLTADHEASDPVLKAAGTADQAASQIATLCREHSLKLILDIVLDRVAADGATV
jgi:starch synthase (maltosyl-transferring)